MNIYDAIMKAADQIERNPKSFDFDSIDIPHCGSPGCALGWVGFFLGAKGTIASVDIDDSHFYESMDNLVGEYSTGRDVDGCKLKWGPWSKDAALCARGMRLYAAKYYAPATLDWNALASSPLQELAHG